ncbi:MAG: hypothetical protein AB1757_09765 [Acidobacteriota bacterium]
MKSVFLLFIFFGCLVISASAQQIQVSPSNVNAYSQGATSVFLTFSNVGNKQPVEGCWAGEVIPATPDLGFKANPATLFGCLPARYNQSTPSANSSYTDVMSIPPSVARRAYLDAANGTAATFFYVRRFVNPAGGPDEYVPVTIRLSGNGAAVPFSLTNVKLSFAVDKPVLFLKAGEKIPKIKAEIIYTGTGRLQGRWEIVKPGEALPTERDLLAEATLPIQERHTQRRFTELSRFNVYLPPTGKFILPGPESWKMQNPAEGMYLILLRIEASDDKTGDSDLSAIGAGSGIVHSGAVAGFPLPVLRYYIGSGGDADKVQAQQSGLALIAPVENAVLKNAKDALFSWTETNGAAFYRLEIENEKGENVWSALLLPGVGAYRAPSFLQEKTQSELLRWRVVALDQSGNVIIETAKRVVKISN